MNDRAPQKRRLETRQRLIDAASAIVSDGGFAALRVEDVVARAEVAKGTFFSHFEDKDRLMALLIGEEMTRILSQVAAGPAPSSIPAFADTLAPLFDYMAQDRVVFDLVVRFSGAMAIQTTELISLNFLHQVEQVAEWIKPLQGKVIRDDVDALLLAEGVQAFAIQSMAFNFCALHNSGTMRERLTCYLQAWMAPVRSAQ